MNRWANLSQVRVKHYIYNVEIVSTSFDEGENCNGLYIYLHDVHDELSMLSETAILNQTQDMR